MNHDNSDLIRERGQKIVEDAFLSKATNNLAYQNDLKVMIESKFGTVTAEMMEHILLGCALSARVLEVGMRRPEVTLKDSFCVLGEQTAQLIRIRRSLDEPNESNEA